MKERYFGLFCIFALIYGVFFVGLTLGVNGSPNEVFWSSLFCAVTNGATLGALVWSKR